MPRRKLSNYRQFFSRHTTVSRKFVIELAKAFGRGNAKEVNEWQLFSLSRLAFANPSYSVNTLFFQYPVLTEEYSLIDGQVRTIQASHPDELLYTTSTSGWLRIVDEDTNPDELEWTDVIARIASARTKQLLRINGWAVLVLNARFDEVQRGTFTAFEMRINNSRIAIVSVEPNAKAKTDVVVTLIPNASFDPHVEWAPSRRTAVWGMNPIGTTGTGLSAMQLEEGAVLTLWVEYNRKSVEWKNRRFVNCTSSKSSRSKTE